MNLNKKITITAQQVSKVSVAINLGKSVLGYLTKDFPELYSKIQKFLKFSAEQADPSYGRLHKIEYRFASNALDFGLACILEANHGQMPIVNSEILIKEISSLGGLDYRTTLFRGYLDQSASADFLTKMDMVMLNLTNYSQCVVMAILCVAMRQIIFHEQGRQENVERRSAKNLHKRSAIIKEKNAKSETRNVLSIGHQDIVFANSDGQDVVDPLSLLANISPDFALWFYSSFDDLVANTFEDDDPDGIQERHLYLENLNFFFKVVWSANELRLPFMQKGNEITAEDMLDENNLWRKLSSYFSPTTAHLIMEELNERTKVLKFFTRCHLLNVAIYTMESRLKEVAI